MNTFNKKWTNRTADLHLPRPRTIGLAGLDTGPAVDALLLSYKDASAKLADLSQHPVTRWEAVEHYSKELGSYAEVLATHASTADSAFLRPITEIPEDERRSRIETLLAKKATRSQGLAAALIFPTYISAIAVALTAFAINDNSRRSYSTAETALHNVDRHFVAYEKIERAPT